MTPEVTYRPMLLALALLVVLGIAFYTAFGNRRRVAESDMSLCAGCATPNPKHAAFCRKCGKRLPS